ncbi:MAG: efflux RND transporter periplasmic adaptor subunit, partial [Xanthomonadales bacterium]|nr:efflux RND transporter periplasmic adaptor subunit [Xanthomonadales bacterium]
MNVSTALVRNIAAVSIAAAALIWISACDQSAAQWEGQPPPPEVSVAEVVVRQVNNWEEFTGRIESPETVEIRPRVNGYIEAVRFEEGREVEKGDVLFVIDQRPYRAAVAQAEAELARARAQAKLAESEVVRAKKLLDSRAISQEEHDQAIAADAQSSANVGAAQAALELARLDLEFTEVRAPISGLAGRAHVTAGNLVSSGQTLLTTVVSLDPVYVYFESDEQVFLRSADLAKRGARNSVFVGLATDKGFPHQGELDFVDNQVNAATGTIRARALLDNADRRFTPGLFARVRLQSSNAEQAVLLDERAVLTDQDRRFVYVLGENDTAQRRDEPGERE